VRLALIAATLGLGCTGAAFDTAEADGPDIGTADAALADAHPEARPDAPDAASDAAPGTDAEDAADTAPSPSDTAPVHDTTPAPDAACPTRCAYPGPTGRFRLVGQSCVDSLDCCSNDCRDPVPGDGVPGVCERPAGVGDDRWCGGAQEWCPDAPDTICRPSGDGGA
jgi:hypothetical protein